MKQYFLGGGLDVAPVLLALYRVLGAVSGSRLSHTCLVKRISKFLLSLFAALLFIMY